MGLTLARCPYCRAPNDCHDGAQPEDLPTTGDVSLCFGCHRPGIFVASQSGLTIRKPTDEEQREIEANPAVRAALGAITESYKPHEAVDLWRGGDAS